MRRITVLAGVAAGFGAFVKLYRPWHHRWGATDEGSALAGLSLQVRIHATRP